MDCQYRSDKSFTHVALRWIVFCLLAVHCPVSRSVSMVDMPQIAADMAAIGASGFSCEGKVIGGYYADITSGCQMFHVCTLGQEGEIQDIKFLCLAGTVFDQETRVCERVDEVDCANSEAFYNLNLDLYGQPGVILQTGRKVPSGELGTLTDEQNLQQTDTFYDYQDYDEEVNLTTTTTPSTTTLSSSSTTTTTTEVATTSPNLQELESSAQHVNELSSTLSPTTLHLIREPHQSHPPTETHETSPSTTTTTTTTTTHRPPRLASEIAEDEDVLRLLGQIEADVPRIHRPFSSSKSSSVSRNSVFVPRIRRDATVQSAAPVPMRRNRTRTGGRRSGVSTTTLSSIVGKSVETASPVPVDNSGPFTCVGRIVGGFYADISSGCQKFYTCSLGKKNRVVAYSFSCGVGLLFDQGTLTCQDYDKVDCSASPRLFYLNDPALRPEAEAKDTFQSLKTKSTEIS